MNLAELSIHQLLALGQVSDCPCGKQHETQLKYLELGSGVLEKLPEMLQKAGYRRPFAICDPNTYAAAGARAGAIRAGGHFLWLFAAARG